jgi:hypothetical protein
MRLLALPVKIESLEGGSVRNPDVMFISSTRAFQLATIVAGAFGTVKQLRPIGVVTSSASVRPQSFSNLL